MRLMPEVSQKQRRPQWTLGERIAKARREADMDQAALATTLGVSRPLVSKWERDQSVPSATLLHRLSRLTSVDLMWILEGDASESGRPIGWSVYSGGNVIQLPLPLADDPGREAQMAFDLPIAV